MDEWRVRRTTQALALGGGGVLTVFGFLVVFCRAVLVQALLHMVCCRICAGTEAARQGLATSSHLKFSCIPCAGFWTEHGPFRLQEDSSNGDIYPAPYDQSWNKIANVIYLEAPVGVGFSYSEDSNEYHNITDAESSLDNYRFLASFFEVFGDRFGEHDFYITAESYGGHYGPTLAEQLIDNENSINMKGLWIGNPGINSDWYVTGRHLLKVFVA